ncbi:rho GTPase-activating protein 20-like protein, partial [Lates japonicus]
DFLRNIPGSVLCVDLYDQWMDAMEGEGGKERTQAVQSLLHLLPSDNLLLLRHVIAILHCIQGNAHDNQMNAFNLSVCIAPSMLWAPAPKTPEMEGEGTKKVCELVHFLIENCSSVLGEDITLLFRNFSQKSNSSDNGSDVSSFQMNDSSYDSLENELNDDPESPYQEQLPLRDKDKPDSRSRDSVITLSDCDPDPDPEADLLLQLPPLARPRRFSPAVRQPRTRQANGLLQGPRRLRRSSEPALALASTPPPGAVTAHANHHLPLSPRGSPPQREATPHFPQPTQPPRTSQTTSHPHGLHPNTWLKRDRRLSLKQPDNGHTEEDLPVVNGKTHPTSNGYSVGAQETVVMNRNCQRRSSSPPSYQQALLQLQRSRSPFYKGTEKPLT